MKELLLIVLMVISSQVVFAGSLKEKKQKEIEKLENTVSFAKHKIRKTSGSKIYDYLNLLPTITVTRRSPYNDVPGSETYIGMSINTSQVFSVTDKYYNRVNGRRKALRKIDSIAFKIRKYINRKYLVKVQLWKYYQIKRSMSSPVEIASLDEKVYKLNIKIDDINIDIEKSYAEIDYICEDVKL